MEWFRSQSMSYVEFLLHEDTSGSILRELGACGYCELIDLQPELSAFQRNYVDRVKVCSDIQFHVKYLAAQCEDVGLSVNQTLPHEFIGGQLDGKDMENTVSDFQYNYNDNGGGTKLLHSLHSEVLSRVSTAKELEYTWKSLTREYTEALERYYCTVLFHNMSCKKVDFEIQSTQSHRINRHVNMSANGDVICDATGQSDPEISTPTPPSIDIEHGELKTDKLHFLHAVGSIADKDRLDFQKMMHRVTRGNLFLKLAPLTRFSTSPLNELEHRLGFVAFFHGTELQNKVKQVCTAFNSNIYCSDQQSLVTAREAAAHRKELKTRVSEAAKLLELNCSSRTAACSAICDHLERWLWLAIREQDTYKAMGLLVPGQYEIDADIDQDVASLFVSAAGWVPTDSVEKVRALLEKAHSGLQISSCSLLREMPPPSGTTPPTSFRTNKYTLPFQEFVDTYGVPRYKEANPALFTAATFPFLFGVMYGDVGHSLVVTLGALYLVATESKAQQAKGMDDILKSVYVARYMLLSMGVCAIYCGIIYNDFFSLTLNLFGSSYEVPEEYSENASTEEGQDRRRLDRSNIDYNALYSSHNNGTYSDGQTYMMHKEFGNPEAVYPLGVDPAWHIAENDLPFFNSMKMKLSVVIGVLQMVGGIILKGMNARHFKNSIDFYCEFIPQLIFALSLFGYIIVLIFIKWSTNWDEKMQLGSCNYDAYGEAASCDLRKRGNGGSYGDYTGEDGTAQEGDVWCYSASGNKCSFDTPLYEVCPLGYGGTSGGCQPPNLVTTLIDIALKPGTVDEPLFAGQQELQKWLLLVALLCVPWMLCLKPWLMKRAHEKTLLKPEYIEVTTLDDDVQDDGIEMNDLGHLSTYRPENSPRCQTANPMHTKKEYNSDNKLLNAAGADSSSIVQSTTGDDAHEEFEFGEICIHQGIETIEFVLGMVSNTASYLRLWALSLAHTQLAQVFWEKIMIPALSSGNAYIVFVAFGIFAAATTMVLLSMDLLECFLHALRLHWIEFQNKFYKADGRKFMPFDWRLGVIRADITQR